MRHGKVSRKFDRNRSQRAALMRGLVRNLFIHERITTTLPKAKEARKLAEHLITLGRKGTVAARRLAYDELQSRDLVGTLFNDIAPLFKTRNGGYTRIIRVGTRCGDGAPLAILELVEKKAVAPKKEKPPKKEKAARPGEDERRAREAKPEAVKKEEKVEIKPEALPKPEKKKEAKPEAPPQKKGFLDGLKNLFGRGKDREQGK